MKRIFLFLMVLGIVMFLGCEKETNTPYEPEVSRGSESAIFSASDNSDLELSYIIDEYRDINPRLYNVDEKHYFLELIYSSLESDKLGFNREQWKTPFVEKLEAVNRMIEKGNYQGAAKKIENDLMDKVDKWIWEEHKNFVYLCLEATILLIITEYDICLINIDYIDHGDIIVAYAWNQILNGEMYLMGQLEGNNEVFRNDPIFWIFADLPATAEPNVIGAYGVFFKNGSPPKDDCDCSVVGAECQCNGLTAKQPAPQPEYPFTIY